MTPIGISPRALLLLGVLALAAHPRRGSTRLLSILRTHSQPLDGDSSRPLLR